MIDFYADNTQPIAGPAVMLPQSGSPTGGSLRPLNSYAILGQGHAILVDAPFSWTLPAIDRLAERGHPPSALILTHADLCTAGDAFGWFTDRGIPIALHPDDRGTKDALATGIDFADPAEAAGHGVEVIPLPGHTPGSILLHLPDEALLLAGDSAVGPGPRQDQTPRLQRPKGADADDRFLTTWRDVAARRRIDGVLPLHGQPYLRRDHPDDFDAILGHIWTGPPMDPSQP